MLKIEFTDKDEAKIFRKIIVNDKLDEDSHLIEYNNRFSAHFYNEGIIEIINSHSFNDVLEYFSEYSFIKDSDWWDTGLNLYIGHKVNTEIDNSIRIQLIFDIETWSKAWSILDLSNELQKSITVFGDKKVKYYCIDGEGSILNGFGIEYHIENLHYKIETEIEKAELILKQLLNATIKNLIRVLNKDSLITYFEFPDEIKHACCQYLIYFTQFLSDIGIEANSEIKEETNKILFRVIPSDEVEALEYIKDALSIYLNAPNSHDFHLQTSDFNNVAVKQWEANVYHLKSQLLLANSIFEAKDATIESLKLSNFQYRQLLNSHTNQLRKEEDLIEGIVALKEYDGKGFSINFAEILRRLKRAIKSK